MAKAFLIDMDGVLVRGSTAIEGAEGFIGRLNKEAVPYLIFTNNSRLTPEMQSKRLTDLSLNVAPTHIFSSALATARFLERQRPGGSAFVVGGPGLEQALDDVSYRRDDRAPDFVVLGEPVTFDFAAITKALQLIDRGARFISTNPDTADPGEQGIEPACGAIAAMISAATGVQPYSIGKPNPIMMRFALDRLEVRAGDALIVGDRMDTDIIAGMESGLKTVLVLSGVTKEKHIGHFSYRPDHVFPSVAEVARDDRFW
ncbi:MAG: HAD-IIA family hydrolase [Pseudomonadota bacterium]